VFRARFGKSFCGNASYSLDAVEPDDASASAPLSHGTLDNIGQLTILEQCFQNLPRWWADTVSRWDICVLRNRRSRLSRKRLEEVADEVCMLL
jgi:hypothetical protein